MTTLTPRELQLILAEMGATERYTKPSQFTGLEKIALVEKLRQMAQENGEMGNG